MLICVVLKHILIVFKIHISFILDLNLQTVWFSVLGHLIVRVMTSFGLFCKAA